MWNLKKAELLETESRMVVARGWGVGVENREMSVKGYKLPVIR